MRGSARERTKAEDLMSTPKSTHDLLPSEKQLIKAMQQIGFGRLESIRIERGEIVLDPFPKIVRSIKLGTENPSPVKRPGDFALKEHHAELFRFVRSTESGKIRRLEIRDGLPVHMETEERPHAMERQRHE